MQDYVLYGEFTTSPSAISTANSTNRLELQRTLSFTRLSLLSTWLGRHSRCWLLNIINNGKIVKIGKFLKIVKIVKFLKIGKIGKIIKIGKIVKIGEIVKFLNVALTS